MADPENGVNEDDRSLLKKAGDALGLGGDGVVREEDGTPVEAEPVVTIETREQTAAVDEIARKKAIRKHLAGNLGDKNDRVAAAAKAIRDPKAAAKALRVAAVMSEAETEE